MQPARLVALPCRLLWSGSPGEVVYEIALSSDDAHIGVIARRYARTPAGHRLADSDPRPGQRLPGLVAGRQIDSCRLERCLVALPDGSVVTVRPHQLYGSFPSEELSGRVA